MSSLSQREKFLLLICFLVVFTMVNAFAVHYILKNWKDRGPEIAALESKLADLELWLDDLDSAQAREVWLARNIPQEVSMTKAQGDLLQFLQDDLFQRKIQIEKQSLLEPDLNDDYQSVAVSLKIRGPEKNVIEWLTTLQGAEKFQVIQRLQLSLDRKSKAEEPQSVCDIVLARWFAPPGAALRENPSPTITEEKTQTRSGEVPSGEGRVEAPAGGVAKSG